MTTDLKTLTYVELTALEKEVKDALANRADEAVEAKKDWMKCEDGGAKHLGRIEELRKKFNKVAVRCNKKKDITLRVKMNVEVSPICFDELLTHRWEQSTGEVFQTDCSGELLNPKDCGEVASEIQEQIDNVMSEVCSEVLNIHGDLRDELDGFVEEWNAFINEFQEDGGNKFNVAPAEVVKANTKKAAKAKPKGKK